MYKHTIRPSWARHRCMPVVTQCEFLRKGYECWQLRRRETLHDIARASATTACCIRSNEPLVCDCWIRPTRYVFRSRATELFQDTAEFVRGVDRHHVIRPLPNGKGGAIERILFVACQAVDCS